MKISKTSVEWAIKHIIKNNDTDIFPQPLEIQAIKEFPEDIINYLCGIDVNAYKWKDCRRFIIPKAENSYRIATQLHVVDSIMFAAIIYEFGQKIEKRRVPIEQNIVFSSRFKPKKSGTFYRDDVGWNSFWLHCEEMSHLYKYATYLDVSDFYNQIYHHTIVQQLNECGIPNEVSSSIIRLLSSLTSKSSRGIPIGPHSSHMLAELALIPFDNSLQTRGIKYCRFCDDIVVFTEDDVEAKIAIYTIADILDKQQRLVLQQQKTRIMSNFEFELVCSDNISVTPINEAEQEIVQIFQSRSVDPYSFISISSLTDEERSLLSKEKIESVINEALLGDKNYSKIRWFYRRLSQVGTPNAIDISLVKFQVLLPALNDIMQYFASVAFLSKEKQPIIGEHLLAILDDRLVKSNDFFQICILNLFTVTNQFNNIARLVSLYDSASINVQREILLAAIPAKCSSWVSEHKEKYLTMSPWCKRAFILASSILPTDEKDVFLGKIVKPSLSNDDVLEQSLIKWALKKKHK
ncbi:MAG: RNA-directed DNA polymerase [Christensenella sp.]|nr:RNA-directed DNA polymerase [Christensenella sp.]